MRPSVEVLLTAVLAGVAAALVLPPPAPALSRPRATPARLFLVAVGVTTVGLVAVADGTWLVLGLIGVAAAVAVGRLVRQGRTQRSAEVTRGRIVEVAQALAGELRSGQPPPAAVARTAQVWPPLANVVQAAQLGADVPTALRRVSTTPGADGLRDLAAAWQVAERSGAGLAAALTQMADAAREREAARRIVAGELASARATARMVAALPAFVLVLGSGLGGDPWGFLLASPAGLVCLGLGLFLSLAGLFWIERIATAVTR